MILMYMSYNELTLDIHIYIYELVGGFNPSEKYESQFPIYGKIRNV